MKVLILGGTQFIGQQIVETLLTAGHTVSILNRGQSTDALPVEVERLRGDRDAGTSGLAALQDHTWNACVDLSGYTPRQVRPSAEMLQTRVQRYVFVSAVSVYGDPQVRPVYETHPRLPPASEDVTDIDAATYGPLKVACEDVVQRLYGRRCALLRPQAVVGRHDQRGRYAYWLQRAQQGGEMLAPGDGTDHLQAIDVHDVAHFARTVIENNLAGPFNLAGPRITWAEFMQILGAQNIVWVPAGIIEAAGLTEFELPLFRPERGPRSGLMEVNNDRARAAGLTLTHPEATLQDLQAWISERNAPPALAPETEAELIRRTREQRVHGPH